MKQDPSLARYLRRANKQNGVDQDEAEEDELFSKDLSTALKNHSQDVRSQNIQSQIEYFGCAIQPFNMKGEEDIGDIDDDGYFVFKRKNKTKDAWLESIKEDQDQDICDSIRKKIQREGGFKNIYDDAKISKKLLSNGEHSSNSESQQKEISHQGQKPAFEETQKLTVLEIKLLLSSQLPYGTKVARFLKEIKQQKKIETYDRIIYLCNLYVELTQDAQIFHMCRQDFEAEEDENVDSPQQKKVSLPKSNEDQDDIF